MLAAISLVLSLFRLPKAALLPIYPVRPAWPLSPRRHVGYSESNWLGLIQEVWWCAALETKVSVKKDPSFFMSYCRTSPFTSSSIIALTFEENNFFIVLKIK